MEAPMTLQNLDNDSLGVLIGCFPPKLRASIIALVCKTWQRVEWEHPYRPVELELRPQDVTASFLTWHIRDTSRLKAIRVASLPRYARHFLTDSYCECVPRLLRHLHAWAPSLRILELVPPPRQGKESASSSPGILPLIGVLSQLECLALRQWRYTVADVADFPHMARLNLKALELSGLSIIHEFKNEADFYHDLEMAAHQLQDTVLSLQLTSLKLGWADFASPQSFALVPALEAGSLTKLRSLTYKFHSRLPDDRQFPYLQDLINLTHLEINAHSIGSVREILARLSDLKELRLCQNRELQPVVLPSAAEVTKLTVEGCMADNVPLGAVLPLETLRHVKSLAVQCYTYNLEELDLSAEWGKLTILTSIALQVVDTSTHGYPKYHLPKILPEAMNLKSIELTAGIENFVNDGLHKGYVLLLTGNLPSLTRIQIDVREVTMANRARLEQACTSLSLGMPNWGYTVGETGAGAALTCIITFTVGQSGGV